jgi:hypothetical protein
MSGAKSHEEVCQECKGTGKITVSNLKVWKARIERFLTLPGGQWGSTSYIDTIGLLYISLDQDEKLVADLMAKKFKDTKCDAVDNYFYETPKSQIVNSLKQKTMPKNPPDTYVDGYFLMEVHRQID